MKDHNSTSSVQPGQRSSHARDLRLAGGISAGLISAILVGGALLAPVADWGGQLGTRDRGGDVLTVRLPSTPSPDTPTGGTAPGSGGGPAPAVSVLGPDGAPLGIAPVELAGSTPSPVLPGVGGGGSGGSGGSGGGGGG